MKKKSSYRMSMILFCIAALLSMAVTWHASGNLLDADASSELVLARHLADTGRILSEDWYYSTELRVVNTQLVFTPLFYIFDDWRLVRFFGAVILQGILVASYYFFTRCARMKKNDFLLGGALLLMPVSIAYGRVVLWHSYYVPHIAFGFVIVGLFFITLRAEGGKAWLWGAMLMAASFLSGLGGFRQGIITHAPLAVLAFLYCLMKKDKKPFVLAMAAGMCCLAGLMVNMMVLEEIYVYSYSAVTGKTKLSLDNFRKWKKILKLLLHQFGYRRGTAGWTSVLNKICIVTGSLLYMLSAGVLSKPAKNEMPETYVTKRFFPVSTGILLAICLLMNMSVNANIRYLSLGAVWSIPMLAAFVQNANVWLRRLSKAIISVLVISALVNSAFVFSPDNVAQTYDGIPSFAEPKSVKKLTEVKELLVREGYTNGYATFWVGNILTEMSDGALRTTMLLHTAQKDEILYHKWLTLKDQRNEISERMFLIIQNEMAEYLLPCIPESLVSEIYRNDFCTAYDITDVSAFRKILENG